MGHRSATSRIVLAATALAAAGLLVGATVPPPVEAACGTNWSSKKEPPESILVLRTAPGAVEEVGLKRYVAVVMASGEWPTSLPPALLEAGALATKQYAWYYALEGNHRDGSKNAAGTCYDVRDDSQDQVYRPESAEPTDKQKAARDALWGLSLRKNGDFFLTGYRQGSATECAADHDEWRLYATSATDCAKRLDYDSIEILHAYYSPKLTDVWAPGTEPEDDEGAEDEAEQAETSPGDEGAGEREANPDESAPDEPGDDGSLDPIRSLLDGVGSLFESDEDA